MMILKLHNLVIVHFYIQVNFILFILLVYISSTEQLECSQSNFKKLEEYGSKGYTIGDRERKFPDNKKKLLKWCRENYKYMEWKIKFNEECVKDFPQQFIKIIEYSYRRSMKTKYCRLGSAQSDGIMAGALCYNTNKKDIDYCLFKYLDELLGATYDTDMKRPIHYCCGAKRYAACVSERLLKRPECDQAKVNIFIEYMSAFGLNRQDVCHASFKKSGTCEELGLPPKKTKSHRSVSLIMTIIELFSVFKESPYH